MCNPSKTSQMITYVMGVSENDANPHGNAIIAAIEPKLAHWRNISWLRSLFHAYPLLGNCPNCGMSRCCRVSHHASHATIAPRMRTIARATGSALGSMSSPQSIRSSISPKDLGPPPRIRMKKMMRTRTRIEPMRINGVVESSDSPKDVPSSSSGIPSPSSS